MDITSAFISAEEMSHHLRNILQRTPLMDANDTAIVCYDLQRLKSRIEEVRCSFPAGSLHAVAMKANPLMKVLVEMAKMGTGVEVASLAELRMAEAAGFPASNIVFDSPAKTFTEITYALENHIRLNVDSLAELERIAHARQQLNSRSVIGLRINPQTGSGAIAATSVSGQRSKFGVALNDHLNELKAAFRDYPWLRAVHVHIGSQGYPVPMLVNGIKKVFEFVEEMNQELAQSDPKNLISTFDIGGGLPVDYHQSNQFPSAETYANSLHKAIPQLFSGKYSIITEFGRYLHANAGWVASRVEYVKRESDYNIAIIHVGADMFLRKCYNPTDWHHSISVADCNGKLKTGFDVHPYWVAGPLCFSGDVIARDILLPVVEEGDFILIHDAGAYTLSMWSRYNSRQMPKVIGYEADTNSYQLLKDRETTEDLFRFWS